MPAPPGLGGSGVSGSAGCSGCPNSGQASLRHCQPSSSITPGWVHDGQVGAAPVTAREGIRNGSLPARSVKSAVVCGRYSLGSNNPALLAERFSLPDREPVADDLLGRANVCPTDPVLAVVLGHDRRRHPVRLRWGLAPHWAKLRGGPLLINARDDKIRSSKAWRPLARSAASRCLIVADGWLEWQKPEDPRSPRQPFLHRLDGPFAFAGLWCIARPRDSEEEIASATIVTTTANRDVAFLHDRMPVVLDGPAAEDSWLDPAVELDGALELARPLPPGRLTVHPVSPAINSNRAEGLELLEPLTA